MFWNKRKRSRKANKNAVFNWIIVCMVAYAILTHFTNQNNARNLPDNIVGEATETAQKTWGDLKQYKNKILPAQPLALTTQDIQQGEGALAVCGQTVSLAYKAFDKNNEAVEDSATKEKPLTFIIGQKKVMPAFDEGIIGMRTGGVRKLFAPAAYAYGAEGFGRENVPANDAITFETELLNVSPTLPDPTETSFRFIENSRGNGHALTCGKSASFNITVWSTEGKKLFTTVGEGKTPLTITPGSSEYILGLEHSALGMKPGGARTAIVPPAFQKRLNGNADTLEIPFPKAQTVLVDMEWVQ